VSTKAAKGYLAARPGTSNHGWGLAADLGVGGYASADYAWMRANAPAFGWDNPGWARPGGTKAEPWHWEFNPMGAAA
jgi:D-alanyl-D-alanine carboxypeptidase